MRARLVCSSLGAGLIRSKPWPGSPGTCISTMSAASRRWVQDGNCPGARHPAAAGRAKELPVAAALEAPRECWHSLCETVSGDQGD